MSKEDKAKLDGFPQKLGALASKDSVVWSDVTSKPDWITSTKPSYAWSEITGKPTWIGSSKPSYTWSEVTGKPTWIGSSKPSYSASEISGLAAVAKSGKYSDLTGSIDLAYNEYIEIGDLSHGYIQISNQDIQVASSNGYGRVFTFPDKTGTLALRSEVPTLQSGAYYISSKSTPPGQLFGGDWVEVKGVFLYCNAGTGTGGSNTHTLTQSELPELELPVQGKRTYNNSFKTGGVYVGASGGDFDGSIIGVTSTGYYKMSGDYQSVLYARKTGAASPINTMPSYQSVYAWRRK